jgi:hypothetical protein
MASALVFLNPLHGRNRNLFYLLPYLRGPASVFFFCKERSALQNEFRWVTFALVALTNLLICHNLVMYSGFRALPDLVYAKKWPYDWLLTEEPVIEEIRQAKNIRIAFTHEKLPYFGYMHWNPKAKYLSPFSAGDVPKISAKNLLTLFPVSGLHMYAFMPIKIPEKAFAGATYLGTVRAIGREAIFAMGNNVEKRHPAESDYILLMTAFALSENGQWLVTFGDRPPGLYAEDRLTFEYELRQGKNVLFHRPENSNPSFQLTLDKNPHEMNLFLTTVVRSAWSGKEVTRTTYRLGGGGMWLPEGGEY